jgi:hypothetical protein
MAGSKCLPQRDEAVAGANGGDDLGLLKLRKWSALDEHGSSGCPHAVLDGEKEEAIGGLLAGEQQTRQTDKEGSQMGLELVQWQQRSAGASDGAEKTSGGGDDGVGSW